MRNFRKMNIWQLGKEICFQSYELSNNLPKFEQFGLKSQMTRSGVSIPSNISEDSGKSSEKEFKKYLETALRSCYELETQILLGVDQ